MAKHDVTFEVPQRALGKADVTARFKTRESMRRFFDPSVNTLDLIVNNDVALKGNMTVLAKFGHLTASVALDGKKLPLHEAWARGIGPARWQDLPVSPAGEPCTGRAADEAEHLGDPHFASYTLDDFPRIKRLLWINRTTVPEICTERARLLTEFKVGRGGNGNGSSSGGLEDQTGQECAAPGDCFEGIPPADIQGEVQCLDRVEGGYCTHMCQDDTDCCAVDGECEEGTTQVCSPFESTGLEMCFIACEKDNVGSLDPDDFCADFHRDFVCRSSGGGSENRKVCVPGGGR